MQFRQFYGYNPAVVTDIASLNRSLEQRTQDAERVLILQPNFTSNTFPTNWKDYKYIKIDVYNASAFPGSLNIKVMGKELETDIKKSFNKEADLPKKKWKTLVYRMSDIAEKMSIDEIRQIEFFMLATPAPYTIYFDNLRMSK